MQSTVYFNRTIEALRRLETYGYQVAYYILQDEDLAMDATKMTLLALAQEDRFYNMPLVVQRAKMRKMIIRESIVIKRKSKTLIYF
ncbi:hypothetical protein [Paenibacillus sp. IHBB 10380]|uniref:hypothetical protein n=1 Tax=Paenibacillus sp. IHBB 10380 TaxID=1566358 RepID=UPI0005CFA26D|nr:hypothetical protein [Paenibacillus sp. IHBB 10380]AJS58174.1 hypothetical protein UB51_06310 [Paenibacillus sp. IHBB 10380]